MKRCSVEFSSVAQSCPTLDTMNRSTPGLPVHHQLLEFTETKNWLGREQRANAVKQLRTSRDRGACPEAAKFQFYKYSKKSTPLCIHLLIHLLIHLTKAH